MRALSIAAISFAVVVGGCSSEAPNSPTSDAANKLYQCESGATVTAAYPSNSTATVQYKGNTHAMRLAVSADGARYTDSLLEWWTKGDEATLSHVLKDGISGNIIENCILRTTP